ncbi:unnamed protein product [Nesidiocoris tenuis]|uniref:Uncharacterized protein n=1 Tax=Nesidiocoris tenuis TaxID=355587 RepID=A0A6H5GMG5_9HEMI|nr:unnamed protein product [Nesidiocoris tenuis]
MNHNRLSGAIPMVNRTFHHRRVIPTVRMACEDLNYFFGAVQKPSEMSGVLQKNIVSSIDSALKKESHKVHEQLSKIIENENKSNWMSDVYADSFQLGKQMEPISPRVEIEGERPFSDEDDEGPESFTYQTVPAVIVRRPRSQSNGDSTPPCGRHPRLATTAMLLPPSSELILPLASIASIRLMENLLNARFFFFEIGPLLLCVLLLTAYGVRRTAYGVRLRILDHRYSTERNPFPIWRLEAVSLRYGGIRDQETTIRILDRFLGLLSCFLGRGWQGRGSYPPDVGSGVGCLLELALGRWVIT